MNRYVDMEVASIQGYTGGQAPIYEGPTPLGSPIASRRRAMYYRIFSADGYLSRIEPHARVLDVGCSDGRGSEELSRRCADGVDIYRPALERATIDGRRTRPVRADLRSLPYRSSSFDTVVALDVIEHFVKVDALTVLNELERVASDRVVIATPAGFMPQPGTPDEPWQEHLCGFEAEELERLGYKVRGMGGPRWLRGDYGRFRGGPIGQLAVILTQPFTPRAFAFALVAVKDVRGSP